MMKTNWMLCVIYATSALSACGRSTGDRLSALSEDYEQLVSSVPHSTIELEQRAPDTVYASPLVNDKEVEKKGGALFLARPTSLVVLNDSIYIVDQLNHGILVSDRQGRLIRVIGHQGGGPSEFKMPSHISATGTRVAVCDFGNLRAQVFDSRFRYLSSIPIAPRLGGPRIAISNHQVLVTEDAEGGFRLALYDLQRTGTPVSRFLPAAFESGKYRNESYSNVTDDLSDSVVCAAFQTVPQILMFDDGGKLQHVLDLRGTRIDEQFDENLQRRKDGRTWLLILVVRIISSTELAFVGPGPGLVTIVERHGDRWSLKERFVVISTKIDTSGSAKGRPVLISDIFFDEERLFLCDGEKVFMVPGRPKGRL